MNYRLASSKIIRGAREYTRHVNDMRIICMSLIPTVLSFVRPLELPQ